MKTLFKLWDAMLPMLAVYLLWLGGHQALSVCAAVVFLGMNELVKLWKDELISEQRELIEAYRSEG